MTNAEYLARVREVPLEALGWTQGPGTEPRYIFRAGDRIVALRAAVLTSFGGLLDLVPDADFWGRRYPRGGRRGGIDVRSAAAHLVSMCQHCGVISPETLPEQLRPRKIGRPRR